MFNVPYDQIDYDQRFVGKVATLALGYQGGVRAFQKMSEAYGTEVSEVQALKIRNDWRDANAPIVQLWVDVEKAARNAISYLGQAYDAAKGTFRVVNGDLLFKLPSGRILSFPEASLTQGERLMEIKYKGMNNHTHRWGEIKAYGGSLVQSITQAVARDILAEAILRLEAADYPVVLHVHDEIVGDVPNDFGSLEEFERLMCVLPKWAEGMPVEAEGYESTRYRK
jgi:DNA polymerase